VHATIDLAKRCRFGPDVEWVKPQNNLNDPLLPGAFDYSVDPARAEAFYAEVRRYWPGLPDESIAPDYAGIRPKLCPPGALAVDFVLSGPRQHGVAGLVHMFGIESPGLTACLFLGDRAASMALGDT
jgi:L-2-hydroxyglutarate oxidase LhgO